MPRHNHEVRIVDTRFGQRLQISGPCTVTGKWHYVQVPIEGYNRWKSGELIQKALPEVSKEDREFLISGCSPAGWQQLWGKEE